jgi:plastocyanin
MGFLLGISSLAGQCVVEGRVALPRGTGAPQPAARYQIKAGSIAPAPTAVAVVYLEGKFHSPPPSKPVVLGQKGYQFDQSILPVQIGTRVEFPNLDEDYHNVFSYSKTRRFDLGRYLKGETPPALVFDKPGIVRLFCEIHEHMRGAILVLDTPYFTRSSPEGAFRLAGVPAGSFVLKAWFDEKVVLEMPVILKPGSTLRVDRGSATPAR